MNREQNKRSDKIQRLSFLSGLVLMLFSLNVQSAAKSIKFGIFPYLNPIKLLKIEKPLKIPVEAATNRPVTLITAPDMKIFISRLKMGEYDLIVVPPNTGRLAQREFGYRSVATANNLGFDFIVRKDSGIEKLEDLPRASLAVTAKQSLSYYFAIEAMDKHALLKNQKIHFCESHTHGNSLLTVLKSECLLAVVPSSLEKILLSIQQQNQLRIIASVKSPLGIIVMTHPRISSDMNQLILQKFLEFNQTAAGTNYLAKRNRDPFTRVDEEKLKSFDVILNKILNK